LKYEKWFQRMVDAWDAEWKREKNERVASLHNQLVKIIVAEKSHIDDIIITLEILLQEALQVKMKNIAAERQAPSLSSKKPRVIQ